jgi:hypothetical protein
MNDWDNTQATDEGWWVSGVNGTIRPCENTFQRLTGWQEAPTWVALTELAIAHVEARAKEGYSYHIEALARHYFRE